MNDANISYEELMDKMTLVLDTMINSSNSALDKEIISISRLTGGNAKKMETIKTK